MSSNSSPPVTLGGEGREEWKKEEKEEGKEERQGGVGGREREVVSIHKQTAVTRMDKMSLCACVCTKYTHRSKTR